MFNEASIWSQYLFMYIKHIKISNNVLGPGDGFVWHKGHRCVVHTAHCKDASAGTSLGRRILVLGRGTSFGLTPHLNSRPAMWDTWSGPLHLGCGWIELWWICLCFSILGAYLGYKKLCSIVSQSPVNFQLWVVSTAKGTLCCIYYTAWLIIFLRRNFFPNIT